MKDNLLTLLRIARIELNPKAKQAICSNLGSAEEFFSLNKNDLIAFQFNTKETQAFDFYKNADLSSDMAKCEELGINLISFWDDNYPKRLTQIYDPPVILYVRGTIPSDDDIFIGVVGSRNCTLYGKTACELVTRGLVRHGLVIVSGGAYGIDSVAHRTTLDCGGKTVAVLGSGIDVPYPASNATLYDEIISKGGAIISEAPLGSQPQPFRFPVRNRLISGLSDGVLVCQAPIHSGSLITANCALEQGRGVYAIPGNITEKKSSGCLKLIKDGALMVEDAEDILLELNLPLTPEENTLNLLLSEKEMTLYELLEFDPISVDTLVEKSGMDMKDITSTLMMMEINGYVKSVPVNSYIKVK
ncbi:MAG: DNA-processing protein DprA [Abditibacteriota bacterium]|nr:DNA-processing protein DprA [Abditibacteriota bacterium]